MLELQETRIIEKESRINERKSGHSLQMKMNRKAKPSFPASQEDIKRKISFAFC